MSTLSIVAFLSVSVAADVPTMPAPADLLLDLAARDAHAALRFCAARPALSAGRGEPAATDVDLTCDIVIRMNFSDALHMPTMRVLGPSMIRALQKSPTLWYQAPAYENTYRKTLARHPA
jgi:hypothetical protein